MALYEVANGVWKIEFLLKNVIEGEKYISSLLELVDSRSIILVRPDLQLLKKAHQIAAKQKISIYDAICLALACETGVELKSLDHTMIDIFRSK